MNRSRLLLVVLCTLALVTVASAASLIDTSMVGGYCNKLCAIGYHCVPTGNGGVCKPDHAFADPTPAEPQDSTEIAAATPYCNKLCAIGYHCIPTGNGGVCKPDHGFMESAVDGSEDSSQMTSAIASNCAADAGVAVQLAIPGAQDCGPCTILCPAGTHLVQKHNCDCKCVGNGG